MYAVIQEVATDEQIEAISDDLPYIPPSDHTIDWVVLFTLFKGLHEESVKRISVPEAVLPKIIDSIYIAFTKLLQYCAVEGVSYDSAIAEEGFFFVFEQVDEWNGLIALAWDKTIADDAYPLHQVVESRRRLQDLKNTVNVSRIPSLIPEWLQHGDRGDVLNALNKTIERLKEHEEVKREQKSQPAPQPEPVEGELEKTSESKVDDSASVTKTGQSLGWVYRFLSQGGFFLKSERDTLITEEHKKHLVMKGGKMEVISGVSLYQNFINAMNEEIDPKNRKRLTRHIERAIEIIKVEEWLTEAERKAAIAQAELALSKLKPH